MPRLSPVFRTLVQAIGLGLLAAHAWAAGTDQDWPMHGLDASNSRFSALAQVSTANVAQLARAWSVHTGKIGSFQATPIVVDGVMYVSTPFNHVLALDAATGKQRWRYEHVLTRKDTCCGPANRGVAVGTDKVYVATIDARLVALDRATGTLVWDRPLAEQPVGATEDVGKMAGLPEFAHAQQVGQTGVSANMAPQLAGGLVLVGVTGVGYGLHVETKDKGEAKLTVAGLGGNEMGLRGYLVAFDERTGEERWRWHVTEAGWEGEFSAATDYGVPLNRDLAAEHAAFKAQAESWRAGGGSVWTTPAVDTARGLIYLGTGNPAPQMDDPTRPGDNRNTLSLVALELATGKLRWAYQQVPHDRWGYDVASPPVLTTVMVNGKPREVVAEAGKIGWLFVHDRDTGELVVRSESFVPRDNFFARPTEAGVKIAPSALGGCSWSPIAVDAKAGRAYVAALHWPAMYYSRKVKQEAGLPWDSYTMVQPVEAAESYGLLSAIDLASGRIAWQSRTEKPLVGGVLATAGGLLFSGESDGHVTAFAASDGKRLWSDNVASGVNAPPVTYTVGGRQFVAVAAGGNPLFGFKTGDELIAYALPVR